MNRITNLEKLNKEEFDICIIGGGASGAGCALDATLRGFKVALIEKEDFAAETSSKSTKLIHGGVRYLEQAFKNLDFAQLRQVKHGLEERHTVIRNAPHLAHPLALITPVFSWFEGFYFTIGLTIYGFFAKNDSMPKAQWLNKKETFEHIPTLTPKLHSSVMYYDGQLDDARYCLALAHSANKAGAAVVNHISVTGFEKDKTGKLTAAIVQDNLSGKTTNVKAKLFINCTGPFGDSIRLLANSSLEKRLRPSKGVHIMLPPEVLKSQDAMLIPKTKDGRVVFVIPFEGEVMVGTTDDEYRDLEKEPILISQEIDFLIDTLRPYIAKVPDKSQIKSGFGGLRPLIASSGSKATKKLVRDHEVEFDETSNLLSLLGGKWTTYRLMAKDTIDEACKLLNKNVDCKTELHYLVGGENYHFEQWKTIQEKYNLEEDICQHLLKKYGSEVENILKIIENKDLKNRIHPDYPFIKAEVIYTIRHEMVCSLRDFFARRTRLELMDWKATSGSIKVVAELMSEELNWSSAEMQRNIAGYQNLVKNFMENAGIQ
ncbi:Aerobic glycerol-3-phosphate dehydrogenase [Emticicia aquatica]|uniref:Glycerol-3-phosphate dehydrogenase n=1 Tax=Emticicia aquatica TaxID=1681835 RepID=A0ABN8EZY9_9BACT|nr:FAD-dependent oxidoreductase [Emticicia aquatica]CAH0997561.1 Aerobic glycerol-3-phosphate dehydrogenase [Emticicia aquatica]